MKLFAVISLVISGIMTLVFGGYSIKSWFDRKEESYYGSAILTGLCVIWLLTAIFLLRG